MSSWDHATIALVVWGFILLTAVAFAGVLGWLARRKTVTYDETTIKNMPQHVRDNLRHSLESTRKTMNETIDSFQRMLDDGDKG